MKPLKVVFPELSCNQTSLHSLYKAKEKTLYLKFSPNFLCTEDHKFKVPLPSQSTIPTNDESEDEDQPSKIDQHFINIGHLVLEDSIILTEKAALVQDSVC